MVFQSPCYFLKPVSQLLVDLFSKLVAENLVDVNNKIEKHFGKDEPLVTSNLKHPV